MLKLRWNSWFNSQNVFFCWKTNWWKQRFGKRRSPDVRLVRLLYNTVYIWKDLQNHVLSYYKKLFIKSFFCIAGKIFRNNDRVEIFLIRIFSAWGVWSHKNQDWDRCKSIDYLTNHYDILVNHVINQFYYQYILSQLYKGLSYFYDAILNSGLG